MDFGVAFAIFPVMLRHLLTLLALITGLAAGVTPVQAAQLGSSVEAAGQSGQAGQIVVVPAVQLQADRARE